MNMEHIYGEIKNIANKLVENNLTYTRADLAFELKEYVPSDSLEISKLIWDAYQYFNKDVNIRTSFTNNSADSLITDEYELNYFIGQGANESLFRIFDARLSKSFDSLQSLHEAMDNAFNIGVKKFDLLAKLTGSKGVLDIQKDVQILFKNYSDLVDSYSKARIDVKVIIASFIEVREEVSRVYKEYTMKLIDIFGDSIKTVAPDLFDFDTISFLNTEGMLNRVKLEYDLLSEKCSTLIGQISSNFSANIIHSAKGLKAIENKKIGLVLAGINMVNHYLDSKTKTINCERELEILKQDIKGDVNTIKADYVRLMGIFKIINDLYIPQATVFYKNFKQVMSLELQKLFDALYTDPLIKDAVQRRNNTLEKLKNLDHFILDYQLNIDSYTESVERAQELLQSKADDYEYAINRKPSKPFFLFNILSFGASGKNYNRDFYEWNMNCAPVIREYEKYQIDLKLDEGELDSQRLQLQKSKEDHHIINQELLKINTVILSKLHASDDIKIQMADHLETIVNLLHNAKKILESKLDDKYLKVAQLEVLLPVTVQRDLKMFTDDLRKALSINDVSPIINPILSKNNNLDVDNLTMLKTAQDQIIQKSINLFVAWQNLKTDKIAGNLKEDLYQKELEKLQKSFSKDLEEVESQSQTLTVIISKINCADNMEEVKDGLLALSGNDGFFAKHDIEQFLNGTKKIEI